VTRRPARPQRGAEERLNRLLVMLPWLMERGEVPLAEVAARFEMTEDEVVAELELVAMCGLPPFVDELVDVFVDEGSVFVGVPRLFTRPLRLNATEAFDLLAAGRAAMALPGADREGALARGLEKLARAVGPAGDVQDGEVDAVEIELAPPPELHDLADAITANEVLRVRYRSAARDEVTERSLTPYRLSADRGNWYVTAHDDRSGEVRSFRVDRIEQYERTGAPGPAPPAELPPPDRWFDDGDVVRITLRLAPAARWVVERYPVDDVREAGDGWSTVLLPVANERWLARLLLRLGPHAEVVEPRDAAAAGRAAAERVLERYRRS
jgi:proteasome accessory factor C